jgi:hypothetical protein
MRWSARKVSHRSRKWTGVPAYIFRQKSWTPCSAVAEVNRMRRPREFIVAVLNGDFVCLSQIGRGILSFYVHFPGSRQVELGRNSVSRNLWPPPMTI